MNFTQQELQLLAEALNYSSGGPKLYSTPYKTMSEMRKREELAALANKVVKMQEAEQEEVSQDS